jgi:hypothetical protein
VIAAAAVVGAVISEALAVYVFAELLTSGADPGEKRAVGAVFFVAVALAGFALPRVIDFFGLAHRWSMAVTAMAVYVVVFGVLRMEFHSDFGIWDLSWVSAFFQNAEGAMRGSGPVLAGFVFLTGLMLRSYVRSNNEIELESLARSIGVPFLLVTGAIVVSVATSHTGEVARAGAGFYAFALLSLACAQLSLSGATFGELRAGGTTAILVAGVAGATIGCVVVFWLVFGVVGPIVGPPLGRALDIVLFALLYPPAWLIEKLLRLLLGGNAPPILEQPTSVLDDARRRADGTPEKHGSAFAEFAGFGFRLLALLAAIAAIGLLIRWITHMRSRSRQRKDEGAQSSLGSMFREDIGSLLGAFRRREGRLRDIPASAAIQLYVAVLDRAEQQGSGRQPGETPVEYAPRLRTAMGTPVTDDITAAFQEARYAGREPSPERVADLRRRWDETR